MMNEQIYTIMTTDVVTVSPEDNLDAVQNILFNRGFHHIPVTHPKTNKLEGIITSFDVLKLDRPTSAYKTIKVREVMTTKVITLEPHELIGAAAMIFMRHLFHGLPIVDEAYQLVGIVTTHDVLKYLYDKEYPDDAFELHLRQLELLGKSETPTT